MKKITTATVEVRMLTVDGKKMTKATFDQIIEEDALVLDKEKGFMIDGTLIGAVFQGSDIFIIFQNKAGLLRRYLLEKDLLPYTLNVIFGDYQYETYLSNLRDVVNSLSDSLSEKEKRQGVLETYFLQSITYANYIVLEQLHTKEINILPENPTEQDIDEFIRKSANYITDCRGKYVNVYDHFVRYLKEFHQIFIAT